MKTIVIGNFKGGVGKSFVAVQLAYYFALRMNLRTCLIDLDAQKNSTGIVLKNSVYGRSTGIYADEMFFAGAQAVDRFPRIEAQRIYVMEARDEMMRITQKNPDDYAQLWTNFHDAMQLIQDQCDVCVIDTPPSIDARLWGAILVGDFIICPIELKEESIEGIPSIASAVLKTNDMDIGFEHNCMQLGVLINRFQRNSQQRKNFDKLLHSVAPLLFVDPQGMPYAIAESKIYSLAQEQAVPVWNVQADNLDPGRVRKASSTRAAWSKLEPVWAQIAVKMRLISKNEADKQRLNLSAPSIAPATRSGKKTTNKTEQAVPEVATPTQSREEEAQSTPEEAAPESTEVEVRLLVRKKKEELAAVLQQVQESMRQTAEPGQSGRPTLNELLAHVNKLNEELQRLQRQETGGGSR